MIPLYTQEEFKASKSRQKLPLKCKHCGKTFFKERRIIINIINKTRNGTGDFCSNRCQRLFMCPPSFVTCEQCGKLFRKEQRRAQKTKHHFCSHSCHATYSNTHKTKGTRCSKLEKWLAVQLPILYPDLEFHFNRKDAINSELDIYIPSLKLAFELNGIFHYEPIYGLEKFTKIHNNDNRKMQACLEQEIELCIIDVSSQKYFKEQTSMKFLEIIQNIISLKISRVTDPIEETT